jgi:hypothetical protein
MKGDFLEEPELEFGGAARHIDIRFGLMDYGPLDHGTSVAHVPIRVGMIGTAATVEAFSTWIERCGKGIDAKPSRYPTLFPRFPGFALDGPFRSEIQMGGRLSSVVPQRAIADLLKAPAESATHDSARVLVDHARTLSESANPDVIVIAPPRELFDYLDGLPDVHVGNDDQRGRLPDLHDLVKAGGMFTGVPIQFVRPETYDERQRPKQRRRSWLVSSKQDEATRAWNIHTALYYKAGGIPWRLARDPRELTACFVGVSFYWSVEGDRLLTSVAQIFNERGDGMILRGGPAEVDKNDRTPYLSGGDAQTLLAGALAAYRREHQTSPARIVIHKSARVVPDELAGFRAAADASHVDSLDVLSLGERTGMRLFRRAAYPPLRGTRLSLDGDTDLLYTRGSVDFFRTYPGMYVPSPVLLRYHAIEQTPRQLASEILALTKMNWNNTNFDGALPITLRAARQVRDILKHVGPGDVVQARYGFYM